MQVTVPPTSASCGRSNIFGTVVILRECFHDAGENHVGVGEAPRLGAIASFLLLHFVKRKLPPLSHDHVWGTVTCIGSTPPCFMD